MADRETRTLSDSLQNQGRFKKLEEFHSRLEATCSKFGRFTIAEFIEEFGFINVSKYGYNSLEEFLLKRGCERVKDGTFVYKENLVSSVKKLLKSFGPPEFLPHNKEFLKLFHSHADSILESLKRFSVETFIKEISVVGPFDPLEYGYSSIEKLLFFRGCRQAEFEFIYDKETALKRKAVIVAAHLVNFTELEFMDTFKMFFQHKIALKKHRFRCLKSLLESVRCIKSDEPEINVIKILPSGSEVEILDVEDYSKRGEGSKLSSRDSQEEKNYAFDDSVVEYVKEDSKGVREKRVLVSDPVDSSITDAGEPVAKKKHTCLHELPPNTSETHVKQMQKKKVLITIDSDDVEKSSPGKDVEEVPSDDAQVDDESKPLGQPKKATEGALKEAQDSINGNIRTDSVNHLTKKMQELHDIEGGAIQQSTLEKGTEKNSSKHEVSRNFQQFQAMDAFMQTLGEFSEKDRVDNLQKMRPEDFEEYDRFVKRELYAMTQVRAKRREYLPLPQAMENYCDDTFCWTSSEALWF